MVPNAPREDDTIVAVSSPAGSSLRAIVRLSGPDAIAILRSRLDCPTEDDLPRPRGRCPRNAHLRLRGGLPVPGRVVEMRAPRTYTREDVVEFHTFGSPPLVREILATLIEAGARLAEPGEFTRRAFRNGRIDLTQAEAVLALVHARSEAERQCATESLAGGFGRNIERAKEAVADLLALVEAALDFSDQDIEIVSGPEVSRRIAKLLGEVGTLGRSIAAGPATSERPRAVLCGPTNAGKSSLLNALAGREHSIVTEVAGTTLDIVEAELSLPSGRVVLVDTPGFLDGTGLEGIDAEAARRAHGHLEGASLILLVVDGSGPLAAIEEGIERSRRALPPVPGVPVLEVRNKIDLVESREHAIPGGERFAVSARTGEGIASLRDEVGRRAFEGVSRPALAAAARHGALIDQARAALECSRDALALGRPLEVVAVDLRDALDSLGEIVGAVSGEEILGRIFGRFCIGK